MPSSNHFLPRHLSFALFLLSFAINVTGAAPRIQRCATPIYISIGATGADAENEFSSWGTGFVLAEDGLESSVELAKQMDVQADGKTFSVSIRQANLLYTVKEAFADGHAYTMQTSGANIKRARQLSIAIRN